MNQDFPMKKSSVSLLGVSLLLLAGGLGLAACQHHAKSPALSRGASASQSIQSAAESVQSARQQINLTLAALRNLTERPGDVPAQYAVLREQMAALEKTAASIASAADAMRNKGDAYLADWGRQVAAIADADLRGAAFERRAETSARLQQIFGSYQKVKADFAPFRASLGDIQAALGADLSARGLEAVRPFVAKATAAAEPLKNSLGQLAADFRTAGLALQPGAGDAPTP